MCYSAQVVQVIRKLHRQLGLRMDYAEAERLFFRRLEDPSVTISRGFEANFEEPATPQGHRIKQAIDEYRARVAIKIENDLLSQKTRLAGATRSLSEKDTKKAREDMRIASNKIEVLTNRLRELNRAETAPGDHRIFPMVHAGVVIRKNGENILTPMRYFCRPAGKPSFYDKKYPGLYNARRDNLEKFWGDQFGHHHAVMVVESFYENVQRLGKNVVLQFIPQPPQTMYVACLWSHWTEPHQQEIQGFAAITDLPPPDVAAAGHDRCIINLRSEHIDAWLTPEGRSAGELQEILSDRAVSLFRHAVEEAA